MSQHSPGLAAGQHHVESQATHRQRRSYSLASRCSIDDTDVPVTMFRWEQRSAQVNTWLHRSCLDNGISRPDESHSGARDSIIAGPYHNLIP